MLLPDKIRRVHFTKEEQILIKARCDVALLDAPPSILQGLEARRQAKLQRPSIGVMPLTRRHSTSSAPGYVFESSYDGATGEQTDSIPRLLDFYSLRAHSAGAAADFKEHPSNSSLSSGGKAFPPGASSPSSVDSNATRPSSSSAASTPSPAFARETFRRSMNISRRLTNIHDRTSSEDSTPPVTRYYRDPETRMKLREYLASPEGFDEALKFGFPRSTTAPRLQPREERRPPMHHRGMSVGARNFSRRFSNSELLASPITIPTSVLTEEDEESDSAEELEEPSTPSINGASHHFSSYRPSSNSSNHSLTSMGQVSLARSARSGSAGDRDMTLRMTLTRPELRAPEEELYGRQQKEHLHTTVQIEELPDPLALEELVLSDDVTGLRGAFANVDGREEKPLRKLWRTLRKR